MGTQAKLFVTCGKEKLFEVGNAIIDTLNAYSRKELDRFILNSDVFDTRVDYLRYQRDFETNEHHTNGVRVDLFDFRCIAFNFGCGDIRMRSLHMTPDCSNDYSDVYGGEKIIFSINHWGKCDEIMKLVGESLKQFGQVYYDHNDCDDESFVKL